MYVESTHLLFCYNDKINTPSYSSNESHFDFSLFFKWLNGITCERKKYSVFKFL